MRVRVDTGTCQATGMCTGLAPDVFELGASTVEVLVAEPDASARDAVLEAVRNCPVGAIVAEE